MLRPVLRLLALVLLFVAAACSSALQVRRYPSSEALYTVGLERFERGKYNDAILAFEKLTFDLPTRDTLLPRAYWYLGQSRRQNAERLLAAQAFIRLAEQFPNDTLADDALWLAAMSYREMWRRPSLDPEYGMLAQAQFRMLQGVFPESPYADSAASQVQELDEWFAAKDFETAMHYVRRRAFDSAILYFQDVVTRYPNTDKARSAMLELVKIYRQPFMNYKEDADEVCSALRAGFPTDAEVLRICKLPVPEDVASSAGW